MTTYSITTATGRVVPLTLDANAQRHFDSDDSYAQTILKQINEDRIYDRFFKGKTDMKFLDIGANVGLVSIYAKDVCQKVLAVEPSPGHFTILEKLVVPMGIKCVNAALANVDERVMLYEHGGNTTMHSLLNKHSGKPVDVRGVRLRNLVGHHNYFTLGVDFVKIDIEGSEEMCLSQDEIDVCAPYVKAFFVETHNTPDSSLQEKATIISGRFRKAGFEVETNGWDSVYAVNPKYQKL